MKTLITQTILLLACTTLLAQAPEAVNYQAVARDGSGNLIANSNLQIRFTLRSGNAAGPVVYQETQFVNTNTYGLFTAVIGAGTVVSGTFSSVSWSGNSHYLQVEVDPGSGFVDLGTTQLVSVPYALHAKTAANSVQYTAGAGISIAGNVITNTSPDQTVTITGTGATTVSGSYPNFTISSTDSDNQTLSISGNNLSISGGNTVTLPSGGTGTITGVTAGTGLTGGGLVGTVTLNAQTTTALWNANQIQGRGVVSTAPGVGQVLKWNGTNWAPANDDVGAGGGITGTGTLNYLPKFTAGTTLGNSLVFDNGTNVGIGTASPSARLHVSSASAEAVRIVGGSNMYISLFEGTNYRGYIGSFSGAAEDVDFGTGAGTTGKTHLVTDATPRLTVAADGKVGIGTTSPASELEVASSVSGEAFAINHAGTVVARTARISRTTIPGAANDVLQIDVPIGSPDNFQFIELERGATIEFQINGNGDVVTNGGIIANRRNVFNLNSTVSEAQLTLHETQSADFARLNFTNQSGATFWAIAGQPSATTANARLNFFHSVTGDILSVTGDGRVGIGTTNPQSQVEISNNGTNILKLTNTSGSATVGIDFLRNGIGFFDYRIHNIGGNLRFQLDDSEFATTATDVIAFSLAGNVHVYNRIGVGMALSTPGADIHIKQSSGSPGATAGIRYEYNSTTNNWQTGIASTNSFWFVYNGSLASFITTGGTYTTSDMRMKENLVPVENTLARIRQMQVYRYNYVNQSNAGNNIGVVAQEVQSLFPELVSEEDGTLGVNYGAMSAIAIKAIQEQQEEIEALRMELEELRQMVRDMGR